MKFSIQEQLEQKKGKIVWLVAYPKSGNTWMRSFLTALIRPDKFHINDLIDDAYFPDRDTFNKITGIYSTFLTVEEIDQYRPDYINYLVKSHLTSRLLFIKNHDLFNASYPYINKDNTQAIIYNVRNPLAVTTSFAPYFNQTIDRSIELLNDTNMRLQFEDIYSRPTVQFPQPLGTWSEHALSWLDNTQVPVHVVRYEDMLDNSLTTFSKVLDAIGLEVDEELILKAIERTSFKKLKKDEENSGFQNKPLHLKTFFRKGIKDEWKEKLTMVQQEKVIQDHKKVMKRLGYI